MSTEAVEAQLYNWFYCCNTTSNSACPKSAPPPPLSTARVNTLPRTHRRTSHHKHPADEQAAPALSPPPQPLPPAARAC